MKSWRSWRAGVADGTRNRDLLHRNDGEILSLRLAAPALLLLLAACAAAPPLPPAPVAAAAPGFVAETPRHPPMVARANAELAEDYLDLAFRLESGRALPVLTRFEAPLTIAIEGTAGPEARRDLARLVDRLRNEAGLPLRRTAGRAAITVAFTPRKALPETFARVACFVVPNVSGLAEFRAAKGTRQLAWSSLRRRERVTIFLPVEASPQDQRDCLHEELAQSIGPLNDLYRLSDSVFNDDNFITRLTGFDMLMLRLHYAPELRPGMTRTEVAAILPALLAQLNPAGIAAPRGHDGGFTPRGWEQAISNALDPAARRRAAAAERAVQIAQQAGWTDSRLGFSWFALGRQATGPDPLRARAAFEHARAIYRAMPDAAPQAAHAEMQLAALALSEGRTTDVLFLTAAALPVARTAGNEALLATLLLLRAEALARSGQAAPARALRLDSVAPARYGFGSDKAVEELRQEIAALAPMGALRHGKE